MQQKAFLICSLMVLLLLSGCTPSLDSKNENISEATLLSEYSLSHGITSLPG